MQIEDFLALAKHRVSDVVCNKQNVISFLALILVSFLLKIKGLSPSEIQKINQKWISSSLLH